jgi:hypothetical protein
LEKVRLADGLTEHEALREDFSERFAFSDFIYQPKLFSKRFGLLETTTKLAGEISMSTRRKLRGLGFLPAVEYVMVMAEVEMEMPPKIKTCAAFIVPNDLALLKKLSSRARRIACCEPPKTSVDQCPAHQGRKLVGERYCQIGRRRISISNGCKDEEDYSSNDAMHGLLIVKKLARRTTRIRQLRYSSSGRVDTHEEGPCRRQYYFEAEQKQHRVVSHEDIITSSRILLERWMARMITKPNWIMTSGPISERRVYMLQAREQKNEECTLDNEHRKKRLKKSKGDNTASMVATLATPSDVGENIIEISIITSTTSACFDPRRE